LKTEKESALLLNLIIWERIIIGLLLIMVSIKGMSLINRDLHEMALLLIGEMNLDIDRSVIAMALQKFGMMDGMTLFKISTGVLLYGLLYLVEGYGLYRRRPWAEYLTVIAIAVFIPFEIYEIITKLTVFRVGALVLNVLIVIFLIRHTEMFPNAPFLGKRK